MRILFLLFLITFGSNAYANSIEILKDYAERGDIGAMNTLGFIYVTGKNVPKSNIEALKWFEKAAFQGHYESMNSLGIIYQVGDGVPSDIAKAWAWYSLAALFIQKQAYEKNIPKSKIDLQQRIPEKIALHLSKSELAKAQALQMKLEEEINKNIATKAVNITEGLGIKYSCPLVSGIEFRVFHILYRSEQEAQNTYSKITADESKDMFESFKLAAKESIDNGTNEIGGDLGFVRANFYLDLMDVILTSPLHVLSTPVKSEYGWHLIWVEDARDAITGISCSQWPNPSFKRDA